MATPRVVVDTNVFIEHYRARDKSGTFLTRLDRDYIVETAAVVVGELYYGATSLDKQAALDDLVSHIYSHDATTTSASRVGKLLRELLKQRRRVAFHDLWLEAICLELGLPLATLNRSHFAGIEGLEVLGPPAAFDTVR